jgi:gamma-glutamyltranspeptidase
MSGVAVLAIMERERQAADSFRVALPVSALSSEDYMTARAEAASAQEVVREIIDALTEARRWIGDGDLSDGMHRSIWTTAYAAAVDKADAAIAHLGAVS